MAKKTGTVNDQTYESVIKPALFRIPGPLRSVILEKLGYPSAPTNDELLACLEDHESIQLSTDNAEQLICLLVGYSERPEVERAIENIVLVYYPERETMQNIKRVIRLHKDSVRSRVDSGLSETDSRLLNELVGRVGMSVVVDHLTMMQ